jgi:hypothetical protein
LVNFYGREGLMSLAERLIKVDGGSLVTPGGSRPILLVEGCGGSGRSALLQAIAARWDSQAPTARVNSLAVLRGMTPADPGGHEAGGGRDFVLARETAGKLKPSPVRLVLSEMMRDYAIELPGYRVSWPRVLLTLIAMQGPVDTGDPAKEKAIMLERLNTYKDDVLLTDVVEGFLTLAGSVQGIPGPVNIGQLARDLVKPLVRRMRRSRWQARKSWGPALAWFAPPGSRDGTNTGVLELIRLSQMAVLPDDAFRREVDRMLMKAFLADLGECVAEIPQRPCNFLLLLDDADSAPGREFLTMLVETRLDLFQPGAPPDPLTVIAAGGEIGALRLPDGPPGQAFADPEGSDDAREWLRVSLDGLTRSDVTHMFREPPRHAGNLGLAEAVVTHVVCRLTAGHALATQLVLEKLRLAPALAEDLGRLLGKPGLGPKDRIGQVILNRLVAGLSSRRTMLASYREDLVTLAAARNREEALSLSDRLTSRRAERVLLTETLWAHSTVDGTPGMVPVARYLLLRELAERDADPAGRGGSGWSAVFSQLLKSAEEQDDLAGRLHHALALGQVTTVTAELAGRLGDPALPSWLNLLDAVVATPGLGRRAELPPAEPASSGLAGVVEQPGESVLGLVAALCRLADPAESNPQELHKLYSAASNHYLDISAYRKAEQTLIDQRAKYYGELAGMIA